MYFGRGGQKRIYHRKRPARADAAPLLGDFVIDRQYESFELPEQVAQPAFQNGRLVRPFGRAFSMPLRISPMTSGLR
jgi:hypothetical protein